MYYKNFDKELNFNDKNLLKILDFYLIQCPVPEKSARTKSFAQLGWKGHKQFAQLKKKLLSVATESLEKNYLPCKKCELNDRFLSVSSVVPGDEYCVFLKSDEKTVIQSLFSAIRNAIAHGSFNIQNHSKTKFYFFSNYDKYLKAEIVLKENTLLSWIDILKIGYRVI